MAPPMWHCYECNAEMRPLMMPDPHCASCHGTFVEMIENEEDDPRAFVSTAPEHDHDHEHEHIQDADDALRIFSALMGNMAGPLGAGSRIRVDRRTGPNIPDTTTTTRFGPAGGVFIAGGGAQPEVDPVPTLGDFIRQFAGPPPPAAAGNAPNAERGNAPEEGAGTGFLRQALLGLFGVPILEGNGQWGDYALNSEGLDAIITQLMEQSAGDRPVPAPEEMADSLPRFKVTSDSPLLTKDCAVCKDPFEERQETLALPCKHSFHTECILPWLKSSATCPVCRFELVPQPKHGGPNNNNNNNGPQSGFASGSQTSESASGSPRESPDPPIPGAWNDSHDID